MTGAYVPLLVSLLDKFILVVGSGNIKFNLSLQLRVLLEQVLVSPEPFLQKLFLD